MLAGQRVLIANTYVAKTLLLELAYARYLKNNYSSFTFHNLVCTQYIYVS